MDRLMRRSLHSDITDSIIWLGLAALAFAGTFQFDRELSYYKFGATGWPRVVIFLLACCAIFLLVETVWKRQWLLTADERLRPQPTLTDEEGGIHLMHLAAPVLFGVLMHFFGFLLTAPLFMIGYGYLLGYRNWYALIGVNAVIYSLIVTIFVKFFNTPLPMGRGFFYTANALMIEAVR